MIFIPNNVRSDVEWNQIVDVIKEKYPPNLGQLHNSIWKNLNPIPFLGDNNITVRLQNSGIWSGWFTTKEKICTNDSTTFLNIDNSTLYTEVNAYGIISTPIIECTFDNEYVDIVHDISNQYIYGYLI